MAKTKMRMTEKNVVDSYVDLDRKIKALKAQQENLKKWMRDKHNIAPEKVSFKGTEHYVNISEYIRTNVDMKSLREDYGNEMFEPYESESECVKLLISHKPKPADA